MKLNKGIFTLQNYELRKIFVGSVYKFSYDSSIAHELGNNITSMTIDSPPQEPVLCIDDTSNKSAL